MKTYSISLLLLNIITATLHAEVYLGKAISTSDTGLRSYIVIESDVPLSQISMHQRENERVFNFSVKKLNSDNDELHRYSSEYSLAFSRGEVVVSSCTDAEDCSVYSYDFPEVYKEGYELIATDEELDISKWRSSTINTHSSHTDTSATGHTNEEMQAIQLMINIRGGRNLIPDSGLRNLAMRNSQLQAQYRASGHYNGNGAEIAYYGVYTANQAVTGWNYSPAHRNIMLGGYTRVGVAKYGANSWTAVFR